MLNITPSKSFRSRPVRVTRFSVRAVLVGERIDIRNITPRLAVSPLVVPVGEKGCAILFRYGMIVFFDVPEDEQTAFIAKLQSRVSRPFSDYENEEIDIQVDPDHKEWITEGMIYLHEPDLPRLQVVAEILAKSVILAYYEKTIAQVFVQIEPITAELDKTGQVHRKDKELLQHIGRMLLFQQNMVGLVEIPDKPELLWEQPELERLYLRLEDEFELRERHLVLERKLRLLSDSAFTLVEVMQTKRSLRVEWYIVFLIVVEIFLSLYSIFFHKG